ncbi:MAG: hypothetical protein ICV78_01480 [Tolypothrix sp. Co-bin9]|nr:hypothetical protein [Tolypothrix sp. Co-bin9]
MYVTMYYYHATKIGNLKSICDNGLGGVTRPGSSTANFAVRELTQADFDNKVFLSTDEDIYQEVSGWNNGNPVILLRVKEQDLGNNFITIKGTEVFCSIVIPAALLEVEMQNGSWKPITQIIFEAKTMQQTGLIYYKVAGTEKIKERIDSE